LQEFMMSGLTPIGIVHTAISMVALVSGCWTLARHKQISTDNVSGRTYLLSTLLTAASGLFIFQHGGFGPPHVLAILTLLALAIGALAAYGRVFGGFSRYVQAIFFSATMLFHLIPGFTESLTRLPLSQPLLPNAEAPELKLISGILLLLFLVGLALQLRWLRARRI
jgi:uncharacterized membrane protein